MGIKHSLRKLLWKIGYDISEFAPHAHALARRKRILEYYAIDTVLDVGANSGQFARLLRHDLGFENRIVSFEPMRNVFQVLKANADKDAAWEAFNYALGSVDGRREINIAANSYSSSLLGMLPAHLKAAPHSQYTGKEIIEVKTLDSLYETLCKTAKNVYMKIDTQGFESEVLQGAANSLRYIDTVEMEMSLTPLYDGELLFADMCLLMATKGYALIAIENGFADPDSGQLLQIDGIFHRSAKEAKT